MDNLEELLFLSPVLDQVVAIVELSQFFSHDFQDYDDILIVNAGCWEQMSFRDPVNVVFDSLKEFSYLQWK